ncbi:MAG: hypothetical protein A3F84_11685 [Candidatus Handelsmanbacteria bacterium RIFCSPLOWO2_12_FULL_64_10]|uniref:Glycosyltransferase 2-like domain-containing protein n=1 Tax=Handelsmanbacteria sp. (strain RIFCSPLOWO2_12_FULL_64_10) TaxID=1817868 RepID=A0A1F6CB82_HANXR|nr:MAG: hypothetical protein A3F84_11685 [Candidatus Handelsmanbacteria bacterium RIFCSPLOWO2_12_FULL_64_10]
MGGPLCSIIVLNYNGKSYLQDCLSSLLKQRYRPFEVVLVDNASTDGSAEFVRRQFPDVKVVQNANNAGFAEGNNIGARNATGDLLIFLNNDTEVPPDWLERLVSGAYSDDAIGVCGAMTLRFDQRDTIDLLGFTLDRYGFPALIARGEKDEGQYAQVQDVFILGACLAIKRGVADRIGLFDPKYFMLSEDIDLCWRAQVAGHRTVVAPFAKVYHKVAGSEMGTWKRARTRYLSERNTIRSLLKNYAGATLLRILPVYSVMLMLEMGYWLAMGRPAVTWAVVRAVGWNLRNLPDTWREHRRVQGLRAVSDAVIFQGMDPSSNKFGLLWEQVTGLFGKRRIPAT